MDLEACDAREASCCTRITLCQRSSRRLLAVHVSLSFSLLSSDSIYMQFLRWRWTLCKLPGKLPLDSTLETLLMLLYVQVS
jgi:hypothetical protein